MRLTDMPHDQMRQLATLAKLRASGGYYLLPGQTLSERTQTLRLLRQEKAQMWSRGSQVDDIQAGRN